MAIVHSNPESLLSEPSTLATVEQSSESSESVVPNVNGKGDGKGDAKGKGKKTSKYFIPLAA